MPLTWIRGDTGSGKTLITIWFMLKYFKKLEKLANFPSKLPNWKVMDMVDLPDLPELKEYEFRIVIRDEGYTDLDKRRSMDEEQIFNTYTLMQHRKTNSSIIGITQLDMMDLRFRGLTKFIIECHDRPVYVLKRGKLEYYKGDFHYTFIQRDKIQNFTLPYKTALKLFPLYKTREKILPKNYEQMKENIRMRNPKEKKIMIDEIVKEIKEKIGIPENKKEITHNWVKNAMLDLDKTNFKLEPFVYLRLHKNRKDSALN